ncbi:hypothetical protein K9L05_02950 [Candidatus Babeliales bacterium]|nr:hypothetical protein [Candidatus Babeliales bacterium]MCF7899581.1 hypothetical protein [Candidatus Babeliales bacterium]
MFKPVLLFLEQKQQKDLILKNKIEKKENVLLKIEKNKIRNFSFFKEKIFQKYKFTVPVIETIPTNFQLKKIDENEANKLAQIVKNMLLEKVPHVD